MRSYCRCWGVRHASAAIMFAAQKTGLRAHTQVCWALAAALGTSTIVVCTLADSPDDRVCLHAGLLGIGGGMIVNPLLLEFNIHPQAAAATSTLMVLFSASSAALSFGFGHQLNLHFALIFGLCCMGASLVGVLLVQRIVKRSGKVGSL